MNLKLFGICFKMRGGPDLLDYIQTNTAVPVEVMEQVMSQMGSITQEEMDYAEKLDTDWKKAFNERVPLIMNIADNGGYDISCTVPDELLNTIHVLTGMENEKIVEEYTADYLLNVCGIDAPITSVDVEQVEIPVTKEAPVQQGFDLNDLGAMPDEPAFEDVSEISGMDMEDTNVSAPATAVATPAQEEEEPEYEDEIPEDIPEEYVSDDDAYIGEDVPIEEGYPEGEGFPDDGEENYEEETPEEDVTKAAGNEYNQALTNIYSELVTNIKEKKLDERLGLQIGL